MPEGWQWDETLYWGSARHYARGRLPYATELPSIAARALGLDGSGRLLDVGTGPGIVALRFAHLFEEVVGLDADADMVVVAAERAAQQGVSNARWVHARAEDLPGGLGRFRVVTLAQSFHWMDRATVASAVRDMLEPDGALVHVGAWSLESDEGPAGTSRPPRTAIAELVRRYLGDQRRAGQGVLRQGTPGGEAEILMGAGFDGPETVDVPGGELITRSVDDLVSEVFSVSGSAPHLFGPRLPEFERDLRALLHAEEPRGGYAERLRPAELRIWRPRPSPSVSADRRARPGPGA